MFRRSHLSYNDSPQLFSLFSSFHSMSDRNEEKVEFASESFGSKFFARPSPDVQIEFGAATHQGRVRTNNEDHYAVIRSRRTNEVLRTNLSSDELVLTDD